MVEFILLEGCLNIEHLQLNYNCCVLVLFQYVYFIAISLLLQMFSQTAKEKYVNFQLQIIHMVHD